MNQTLTKPKWGLYLFLVVLILASNAALYRLPIMQPVPDGALIGSLLDFLVVIPLLTYFFILRKRYSLTYIGPVVLAGFLFAHFMLPEEQLAAHPLLPAAVLAFESIFIAAELFLLFLVLRKIPLIRRDYLSASGLPYFHMKAESAVCNHISRNKLMDVFLTEASLFYYALLSWKKKAPVQSGTFFSSHHKTNAVATSIMLIHAIVLETAAIHFFLHSFSPVLSWVLLILNLYGVLFLLADMQAIRLCPYHLSDDTLHLQAGISKKISIPLELIRDAGLNDLPEKRPKEQERQILDLSLQDLVKEKPAVKISLKEPVSADLLYGFKKEVTIVLLNADEAESFIREIRRRTVS